MKPFSIQFEYVLTGTGFGH